MKSNKYPVKIRVYTRFPRKQKLYPTKFEFTEKEFNSTWNTIKPINEVKTIRAELEALVKKAEQKADELPAFTFESFEKLFYMRMSDRENVFYQYEKAIQKYTDNKQIGTASNYTSSMKSIKTFLQNNPERLLFREITPDWLNRYEAYMTGKGKSNTTVSMYMRALRTLFNSAISEGIIQKSTYPFGDDKFVIPGSSKVKKALDGEQLEKLFMATPATPEQLKAKDYFFFMYNTFGTNVKDVARLKYQNMDGNKIEYTREKTKRTTKKDPKKVVVYLNDHAKLFIEKYGHPDRNPRNYIFDIYNEGMTEEEKFRVSHNFTRFINQHLKELAKANGLPEAISTYWSRHSFATHAIRSGFSIEKVSQALNHKDIETTMNYFAGFEPEAMKEISADLMSFNKPKE